MRSTPRALLLGWFAVTALALAGCRTGRADPPGLVVLVAVDQLTPVLLERYQSVFTGGFRRLLSEGYVFTNAVQDHARTATAPGHATLATGVYPSRHGIVANDWREQQDGRWRTVNAVEDPDARIVGAAERPGRSPRNLLRGGLANWVVAADSAARVVSVAGKDRSAITLAGTTRGEVYWWDDALHQFVTSTYYRDVVPDWVQRFNADLPKYAGDACWSSTAPPEAVMLAYPDPDAEKGGFRYCATSTDPAAIRSWMVQTPLVDAATLDLAAMALTELDLGHREGGTDFLAISLSQGDRIGHRYGPFSQQQLDNLLHMDRVLGEFLDRLDAHMGRRGYVLALSADHGVMDMPEMLQAQGVNARRVTNELNAAIRQLRADIAASPETMTLEAIAARLEALDFIEQVVTRAQMASSEPTDSFTELFRRSYYEGRETARLVEFDFELRFSPYVLTQNNETNHGTPYLYDRHVPLIFFGHGIAPGASTVRVRTVDVAPTLAALAGVPVPSDLDGQPILGP